MEDKTRQTTPRKDQQPTDAFSSAVGNRSDDIAEWVDGFLDRLRTLHQELSKRNDIQVNRFEIFSPATAEQIQKTKRHLGRKPFHRSLEPEIEAFFSKANGFVLDWHCIVPPSRSVQDSDREQPTHLGKAKHWGGHINIVPIQEIFHWEMHLINDYDEKHQFRYVHCLDSFVSEACAAFWVEPNKPSDNDKKGGEQLPTEGQKELSVVYHFWGEECGQMRVNFQEYLDLALKARGFFYWQRSIAAVEESRGTQAFVSHEEKAFREAMPILFGTEGFRHLDFIRVDCCVLRDVEDYEPSHLMKVNNIPFPPFQPRDYEALEKEENLEAEGEWDLMFDDEDDTWPLKRKASNALDGSC